ncbi:MAG TPA: phosphatase PAP2 family protein [Hymenobacter sp.]|jgi:membrane-associated phospholipid phosphatase|uniref:phosphatase PAP2 family protein n=1 Tax=Hymenobacter sp. TaxID=1898978 RepID=UPI002ED7B996
MTLRQLLYFTAFTLAGCSLLIAFFDQPLALFVHQYFEWTVPFFTALTNGADAVHSTSMTNVKGFPILLAGLLVAYLLCRWGLRKQWENVFLVVLLIHLASQAAANVLKGVVHRLRPEVLFQTGYPGLDLWANGPHNDSFPSSHTAVYVSLFLPLAVAFPRYRAPLLVLPGLIALGRVFLGEHYLSDVWFSVWLVAAFTFLFGWLVRPRAVWAPAPPYTAD